MLGPWLLLAACSLDRASIASLSAPVVYGADDRVEVFDASAAARELAQRSVVALVPSDGDPWQAPSWTTTDNVCPDEKFANQPDAADCSGVLAAPDLVLTAGHCTRGLPCADLRIVFGFYYDGPDQPHSVTSGDVYRCAEVVEYSVPSALGALDYGWIRLDRPVTGNARPATIRRDASPLTPDTELTAIGFPSGLPAKVREGGALLDAREAELDFFISDLDLFGGDSGAPIFDDAGQVVGIASGGESDTAPDPTRACELIARVDANTPGAGERSTYAFQAVSALCESGYASAPCPTPEADASCRVERTGGATNSSALLAVLGASIVALRRARRFGGRTARPLPRALRA